VAGPLDEVPALQPGGQSRHRPDNQLKPVKPSAGSGVDVRNQNSGQHWEMSPVEGCQGGADPPGPRRRSGRRCPPSSPPSATGHPKNQSAHRCRSPQDVSQEPTTSTLQGHATVKFLASRRPIRQIIASTPETPTLAQGGEVLLIRQVNLQALHEPSRQAHM
jgi:hypothetical protein